MLKQSFRFTLMCIAYVGIAGFFAWGMTPQESAVTPDETLYETGMKYLENDQYEKARIALQSLINSYPDSEMTAEAYFAVGDTYYEEGGTENLQQAIKQYSDFIKFFPVHPKAMDAQFRIISSKMKMMGAPDRDRLYTLRFEWEYMLRIEREMRNFIELFPNSENAPLIRQWLERVQEILNKTEQIDNQNNQNNQ